MPIRKLLEDSSSYIYASEIKKIAQKGIEICEIKLPLSDSLKHTTTLETLGKLHDLDFIYVCALANKDVLPNDFRKTILEEILGSNVINALLSDSKELLHLKPAESYKLRNSHFKKLTKNISSTGKIYLLGSCIVDGHGNFYTNTFPVQLQLLAKEYGFTVIAIPIDFVAHSTWADILRNLPICENDIILTIHFSHFFQDDSYKSTRLDMTYIYNNPKRETFFIDNPVHSNARGNEVLAQEIYNNYLKEQMKISSKKSHKFIQMGNVLSDEEIEQVTDYVETIKQETTGSVGAIVMNCNPFTYGHQYLIEYAASQVDWLYIFVVEENRSFFLFEDRFNMVKQGTSHLNNVIVVPSGKFVLSYETGCSSRCQN